MMQTKFAKEKTLAEEGFWIEGGTVLRINQSIIVLIVNKNNKDLCTDNHSNIY